MDSQTLKKLQKCLGYRFKDKKLIIQALTHPSFVQGTDESNFHNQRLEFLGDSVVGMVVADELFKIYPDEREGYLTQARAHVCHGKNLTDIAKNIGLEEFLQLGKGELRDKSANRSQMLGDCLEAVIGAIYLDGGYKPIQKLILNWVRSSLDEIEHKTILINHKGALQEWAQSKFGHNPFRYELVSSSGPDHAKQFKIKLIFNDHDLLEADGFSKKEAETKVAKDLMNQVLAANGEIPDLLLKFTSDDVS